MDRIVDTNVLVVANDSALLRHPSECVTACCDAIEEIEDRGRVVLDSRWEILGEYEANVRSEGQPGVGDAFLKWILTNLSNPRRCLQVPITPLNAPPWYGEFPERPDLAGFDRNDRKFVAVALSYGGRAPILNAVDTDWWIFRSPLEELGVKIEFLCPDEMKRPGR